MITEITISAWNDGTTAWEVVQRESIDPHEDNADLVSYEPPAFDFGGTVGQHYLLELRDSGNQVAASQIFRAS